MKDKFCYRCGQISEIKLISTLYTAKIVEMENKKLKG
jgi:hypothetical protein